MLFATVSLEMIEGGLSLAHECLGSRRGDGGFCGLVSRYYLLRRTSPVSRKS